MYGTFSGAKQFNQPLNDWNVSNVTNMEFMFYRCYKFKQPLNKWDISNVIENKDMFSGDNLLNYKKVTMWGIFG